MDFCVRVLEPSDERLVLFPVLREPLVHRAEPREQLAHLAHREVPVHPRVEDLVLLLDVLRENPRVSVEVRCDSLPVAPRKRLAGGPHESTAPLVVLAHRLEDVEAGIEEGKEDVLFLGVVEAVGIRPYEVEAVADKTTVRLRPRVEAIDDGGENGEEPLDVPVFFHQRLHRRRVRELPCRFRPAIPRFRKCDDLAGGHDAGNPGHQRPLVFRGEVMDLHDVREKARAHAARDAPDAVLLEKGPDRRVLPDDLLDRRAKVFLHVRSSHGAHSPPRAAGSP